MAVAAATVVALAAAATPVLAVVALAADIWASAAAARISAAWRMMEFGGHAGAGGIGLRQHAFHRFGRYRPGYGFYGAYPDCYDWYELHPDQPLPLSCS